MSSYERNRTMVACIVVFIVVVGAAIGVVILFMGSTNWNWNPTVPPSNWDVGETFEFERTESSMPLNVTLDFDVDVGGIDFKFIDDPTLLYYIEMWVPNETLQEYGDPTVTYTSNTVALDYPAAGVNVTLGNNTLYIFDVDTLTGGVKIALNGSSHIGDIDVDVTTGGIALAMTSDVTITSDITISLTTTTGGIAISIDLPADVGGRFTASVSTGGVNVEPTTWNEITEDRIYETSDFNTATHSVTISATTTTGGIGASLN